MKPHELIRNLRLKQGRTQFELAVRAKVSLPTIQKIEAGTANPGWSIVESILHSLNYEIQYRPMAPHWEELASYGIPLSSQQKKSGRPARGDLVDLLKSSLTYGSSTGFPMTREWEALAAFLLGLKTHFPEVWADLGPLSQEADRLIKHQDWGRLLKLRRLAIASQAKYL
jgi:transcriptional regulator with XRE-family HTH domain